MARPRKVSPSYVVHTQSGRGRLVWTDTSGHRHDVLLPGPFGSPESLAAKARYELELVASPHHTAPPALATGRTVSEVLLAFLKHAEGHHRSAEDGRLTNEYAEFKLVSRHLRELYGPTPADDFGPLALKAVRQKFVAAGWCRRFINHRVGRIKRIFKWAASEELVRIETYQRLTTVNGLQKGRTPAREPEPIGPVDDATVDATLPFLNRHVAGLVEFQRLTGCRPGEACRVRPCDIDTDNPINPDVWLYRPPHHKNAHSGKPRTIPVGRKAQAILNALAPDDPTAYYFSPAGAVADMRAERKAKRKRPATAAQLRRDAARWAAKGKAKPIRPPAGRYVRHSYRLAVARACDKAFPPPAPLALLLGESEAKRKARLTADQWAELKAWQVEHHWHPNQLRHTHATEVRRDFGLEAAQAVLGHSKADVTQIYAERNIALAVSVAAKIG